MFDLFVMRAYEIIYRTYTEKSVYLKIPAIQVYMNVLDKKNQSLV